MGALLALAVFTFLVIVCGDDAPPKEWDGEAWRQWQDRHRW